MKFNNWISIDYLSSKKIIPKISCCYSIYLNQKLVYIGSTYDLRERIFAHSLKPGYAKDINTPWGLYPCESLVIKYRPSKKHGDWLMFEARLIRKIKPIFNSKLKR